MLQKPQFDNQIHSIANVLILNSSFIQKFGLLDGKMGISIYFYKYYRYSNNKLYERFAERLLEDVYKNIQNVEILNIESGIPGICLGIVYLVQNKYIEADLNDIFKELDNTLFGFALQLDRLDLNNLVGLTLYSIIRSNNTNKSDNNLSSFMIKHLLGFLMESWKNALLPQKKIEIVPTLFQINILIYFLIKTHKFDSLNIFSNWLISKLMELLNDNSIKEFDIADISVFNLLIKDLEQLFPSYFNSKIYEISQSLYSVALQTSKTIFNPEMLFIKINWLSILFIEYNIHFDEQLKSNAMQFIVNSFIWNQKVKNLMQNRIGLNTIFAGTGFAILNEYSSLNINKPHTNI